MSGVTNPFEPPTLHIVVADDDVAWARSLEASFLGCLLEWSFYRSKQFLAEFHVCGTVEELEGKVDKLLRDGGLVYTTIDLNMPMRAGDNVVDPTSWEHLVSWGLDQKDKDGDGRFDFCVITQQEHKLERLWAMRGPELTRRSIKKALKDELESRATGDITKGNIWLDIKAFVLNHIRFCVTEDGPADTSRKNVIWFGSHEGLARLRADAERIAERTLGGLYLLFADAAAYEQDWFQLVCQLRRIKSPRILDVDHYTKQRVSVEEWYNHFNDPPEALLVRHIDRAADKQCKILEMIERSDFFSKIESERRLVLFQFPYIETQADIGLKLDKEEKEILDYCRRVVHADQSPDYRGGFAFQKNSWIVTFPTYDTLANAGVISQTVAFQVRQCQERHKLPRVPLDPEVEAVLKGIRWENEAEGIGDLREAIDLAYSAPPRGRP